MNAVDAIVLGLLAIGDLALVVRLRRARARQFREERVARSLRFALQRGNGFWATRSQQWRLRNGFTPTGN